MTTSSMPFYSTTRSALLSSVLAVEDINGLSRETGTLLAGSGSDRAMDLGTVIGCRLLGDITIGAKQGGNTGTGALGTASRGAHAKVGTYVVTCIETAANGGRFQVVDPDGYRLSDALVGVAYAGPQVNFTIADGGTDYVVGDGFAVTIAKGDGKWVQLDPEATDGSQLAHGVLTIPATAPDGADVPAQAVTRLATIIEAGLVWPAGISDQAKAAALARLEGKSVFTRTAA